MRPKASLRGGSFKKLKSSELQYRQFFFDEVLWHKAMNEITQVLLSQPGDGGDVEELLPLVYPVHNLLRKAPNENPFLQRGCESGFSDN
jgi:hypothetical protein